LIQALHLPSDTRIVGASLVDGIAGICVELVVEHTDLTGVPSQDAPLPWAMPTFHRQEPIVFEGWNQK
jgi:hypothetical protein